MERPETEATGLRPVPGPGGSTPDAAELWERFRNANERMNQLESWCAMLFVRLGARRGMLLLGAADIGPYAPAVLWPEGSAPDASLTAIGQQTLERRRSGVGSPGNESAEAARQLVGGTLAHPILVDGRLYGALVLEVPARPEAQLRGQLRELIWGCGWLESWLRSGNDAPAAAETAGPIPLEQVLQLVACTLEHGRFRGAATAFATELATLMECSRVSLGFVDRGRIEVHALSHSADFKRKTNLVADIEAAMEEAFDQQCTIVHPSLPDELPLACPAHETLVQRHETGPLCSIPIFWDDEIRGVLMLDRKPDRPFDAATIEACEVIAGLAGPMLEVRRRDDRWLGTKIVEAAREQAADLVGPHHVALKLAAFVATALLFFLLLAKGDFRVTADAVLEPAELRAAVAPFRGYIDEAPARAGDLVEAGDLLASLDSRELNLERLKWASQLEQLVRQSREALAARDAAEAEILDASAAQARAELHLIEDRLAQTEIRAPFSGVVVSGDLSQQIGAPTDFGDVLFEVAPLSDYRLIVQVDERDVAHVEAGQKGQLVLASLPDDPLSFSVRAITPVSEAAEGANRFRVEATLAEGHPRLRPGMEGVGKIEIDRRRLAWIWTHEGIDWLRLASWEWLP